MPTATAPTTSTTVYTGTIEADGPKVTVRENDGSVRPLQPRIMHAGGRMTWGSRSGDGADLARSILFHALGFIPPSTVYHRFNLTVLAGLPAVGFTLTGEDVEAWLDVAFPPAERATYELEECEAELLNLLDSGNDEAAREACDRFDRALRRLEGTHPGWASKIVRFNHHAFLLDCNTALSS